MAIKWERHTIITGVTEEMKKALPRGLRCKDNMIKVPPSPHPLNRKYLEWCRKFGIGNGFLV